MPLLADKKHLKKNRLESNLYRTTDEPESIQAKKIIVSANGKLLSKLKTKQRSVCRITTLEKVSPELYPHNTKPTAPVANHCGDLVV